MNIKPKNVCVLLRNGDEFYFSIEKSGKYGLFGGKKEPGESTWEAAKREFEEEVGKKIPWMTNVRKLLVGYNGHTVIYCGHIKGKVEMDFQKSDGELKGIKVIEGVPEVLKLVEEGYFRSCATPSMPYILDRLSQAWDDPIDSKKGKYLKEL